MIVGSFYTYRGIHFTSESTLFCDICLSVCLSVCHTPHVPLVHSILERRKNFIFYEELTREWWSNFETLSSMFQEQKRIIFAIFVFVFGNRFLQIAQNFLLSWHTDSTPDILLHDCQEWRLLLIFLRWNAPKFLIGDFLKVHLTSNANRTWSAFVLLCRRRCSGDTTDFFRTRYFPYLSYRPNNIIYAAIRTTRSTSSMRAFLLCRIAYGDDSVVSRSSVRLSVPCLHCHQFAFIINYK